MLRRKRKKDNRNNKNNYFDENTEKAIVLFQNEEDVEVKKSIFEKHIQYSFLKLVENIIFVYKFHSLGNVNVLKNDCVSFLFECIHKFKGEKGAAFSYFNVVAKNWFIQQSKLYKKNNLSNVHFDKTVLLNLEKSNNPSAVISYEDIYIKNEFFELLKEEVKSWRDKFAKDQERKVLESVIFLLENPDLAPIYNKKGVYMYLKEICGGENSINTKQLVTNLTKFRKRYETFKNKYFNGDV